MTQGEYDDAVELYLLARERERIQSARAVTTANSAVLSVHGTSISGASAGATVDLTSVAASLLAALGDRELALTTDINALITSLGGGITP